MKNIIYEAMRRLQEMSENKVQIRQDIVNVEDKIIEHLLKCFLYKNTMNNLKHWEGEIYSFLHRVPKLKNTKKYPSYKLLYNFTIERIYDDIDNIINLTISNLEFKNYPKVNNINKENLGKAILEYYDWLIEKLSKNGGIVFSSVCNKIDELISKYNF